MPNRMLYKENYEYSIKKEKSPCYFHLDYGMRYYEINMSFEHFHPFYEIYVLLNGTFNHIIEGKNYPLKALDMVILKPYTLHKTQYINKLPCKRLVFNFSLDFINNMLLDENINLLSLVDNDFPVYRFNKKTQEIFIELFNNIFLATKDDEKYKNLKVYSLFYNLIYEIIKNKSNNIYNKKELPKSSKKIDTITSYIHKNYHLELNLSYLSKKFFLSPHYLSHKFKNETGFTLTQYIHLTRIKKAEELLIETRLKSIEIGERCGFGSLSQFNRIFKKICKVSPTEYRKESS